MRPTACGFGGLRGLEVPGAGWPLLCVHGNSADHRTFERLLTCAPLTGRHLVALDLPGHGGSPWRPGGDYGLQSYAEAVERATSALGDCVLFGHSLGGHVALQGLAAGRFATCRGLAVLGTPPLTGASGLAPAFQDPASMAFLFRAELSDADVALWGRETFGGEPPAWFAAAVRATDPEARRGLGDSIAADALLDECAVLESAPFPVAVLHAEADPYVSPGYITALRGRALWRGAVQELANAGHFAPFSAPDAVGHLLAAFLNDLGG